MASLLTALGCEVLAGIESRTYDPSGQGAGGTPSGSATGTLTDGGGGSQGCGDLPPGCQPFSGGPDQDRWPDSSRYCFGGNASCASGEDGERLGPSAYTPEGDGTIVDQVTGLAWQASVPAIARFHDGAESYCSGLGDGPRGPWRLPAFHELLSLIDYGTDTMLPGGFDVPWPGLTVNEGLWVRDEVPRADGAAWHYYFMFDHDWSIDDAHFEGGEATWGGAQGLVGGPLRHVLCVSGGAMAVAPAVEPCCEPPIARDPTTGLVWEANPSATPLPWDEARAHCAELAIHDGGWRLATVKELGSIFRPDERRNTVAGVPPVADDAEGVFWTATPSIKQTDPPRVFVVDFTTSSAYVYPIRAELPSDAYRAWCVRSYDPTTP